MRQEARVFRLGSITESATAEYPRIWHVYCPIRDHGDLHHYDQRHLYFVAQPQQSAQPDWLYRGSGGRDDIGDRYSTYRSIGWLSGRFPWCNRGDRAKPLGPTHSCGGSDRVALGVVAGLITAFPVAKLGIPSFVASLAGWLIYRGALQLVTEGTGTIIITDNAFNAIGNAFIPDIPDIGILSEVHKLTLLIGIVAVVLFIVSAINDRRKKQSYNFDVLPMVFLFSSCCSSRFWWVGSSGYWPATTACPGRS